MTPDQELAQLKQKVRRAHENTELTKALEQKAIAAGILPGVAQQVAYHAVFLAKTIDINPDEALAVTINTISAKSTLRATQTPKPTPTHRLRAKLRQIVSEVLLRR